MFKARFAIPIIGVIALSLMLPGVASANTASVKCDSTGVVFTYNADFGRSKVSTEIVNGVSYAVHGAREAGQHAHLARRHRRHLRQRFVERRVDPEDQAALPAAAPAPAAARRRLRRRRPRRRRRR